MEKHRIYCSACDREVEVLLREGITPGGTVGELDGAVCSDIGPLCTGAACPIGATPPVRLRGPEPRAPDTAA